MKTLKLNSKNWNHPIFRITAGAIFLFLFSISLNAQNSNSAQWKNSGGIKVLSGNHHFEISWTSNSNSRDQGMYWKGSFYETNPQYSPWDPEVKNSVAPIKGQFTVQGPGHIGLSQQSEGGASIVMYNAKTKEGFHPFGLAANINPDGEFWGKIPADMQITIVVEAQMSAYNNMMNTGEYAFHAPQGITEFEVWFFPQGGGKIINIDAPNAKFDKPKPGILYYIDNECK